MAATKTVILNVTEGCRGPTLQFPAKTGFGCDREVQRDFPVNSALAILEEFPLASSAPSLLHRSSLAQFFSAFRSTLGGYFGTQKEGKKEGPKSNRHWKREKGADSSSSGAVTSTVPRHNLRVRKMNAFFLLRPNYPHFHPLFSCIENVPPSTAPASVRIEGRPCSLSFHLLL